MADHTIAQDQVGVYEILLTAGNPSTVEIINPAGFNATRAQVSVHEASMPVYARPGNKVSIKDPQATVVLNGTWVDMQTTYQSKTAATVTLISAADATVSVARS